MSSDQGGSQKASDKAAFQQRHKWKEGVRKVLGTFKEGARTPCGCSEVRGWEIPWGTHSWRKARVEQGGGRDPGRGGGSWV